MGVAADHACANRLHAGRCRNTLQCSCKMAAALAKRCTGLPPSLARAGSLPASRSCSKVHFRAPCRLEERDDQQEGQGNAGRGLPGETAAAATSATATKKKKKKRTAPPPRPPAAAAAAAAAAAVTHRFPSHACRCPSDLQPQAEAAAGVCDCAGACGRGQSLLPPHQCRLHAFGLCWRRLRHAGGCWLPVGFCLSLLALVLLQHAAALAPTLALLSAVACGMLHAAGAAACCSCCCQHQ